MPEQFRREFLKTASGGALGALGVGTVATGSAAAYDKDFRQEVGALLTNGKLDKAKALLESEGVNYSMNTRSGIYDGNADIVNDSGEIIASEEDRFMPEDTSSGETDDGGGPAISPNTYKPPGDGSTTWTSVTILDKAEEDVYDIYYAWSLDQRSYTTDSTNQYNGCGSDGAAIFWNKDYFSATSVGRSNFDNLGNSRVSYNQWKPGIGGVAANVDDPDDTRGEDPFDAGFVVELEAVADGAANQNIVGQYEHTWVGALTWCYNIDVSINLGLFSLSTSGTPYTWHAAASNRIPNTV